jgi:hypothetical protein
MEFIKNILDFKKPMKRFGVVQYFPRIRGNLGKAGALPRANTRAACRP